MQITTIGIDLAKNVFQVHKTGQTVVGKARGGRGTQSACKRSRRRPAEPIRDSEHISHDKSGCTGAIFTFASSRTESLANRGRPWSAYGESWRLPWCPPYPLVDTILAATVPPCQMRCPAGYGPPMSSGGQALAPSWHCGSFGAGSDGRAFSRVTRCSQRSPCRRGR